MTTMTAVTSSRPKWQTLIVFALAFWLSTSLFLDLVIMPGMYAAGMMAEPGFASTGYSIFWMFNRLEVLCAALVLTGALGLYKTRLLFRPGAVWVIGLPLLLLTISLLYTYGLTPSMSALGLQLDLFNAPAEVPQIMTLLHQSYWVLEMLKLAACGALLNLYYRAQG